MRLVLGTAQHYDWGDTEAIPRLLGLPVDGRPWAEWWWGTHPSAPSTVLDDGPLAAVSGELPYLLKVLAAARPLSLQTHPDSLTAAAGFAREHAMGILLDDPRRTYKDPFAKPELIVALTPFEALCGFRPIAESVGFLRRLGADDVAQTLTDEGLSATVAGIYRGTVDTTALLTACSMQRDPSSALATRLAAEYPGDPSVAVTLLLHHLVLSPGEALYLAPGNLHAYVSGVGVEVMGASDNVLRGGMTTKHVDVDELLRVVDCSPIDDPRSASSTTAGVTTYATPGAPFLVRRHDATAGHVVTGVGPDLVLCTSGSTGPLATGSCALLGAGETFVIDAPCTLWQVSPASQG
ncbi:MAG: mannose-6-phosphate isomerase [Actinomycetota bacterium]|jgi:mannose-6-phosphate isomerase